MAKRKEPRPVARRLYEAVAFDLFPDSPAVLADFFITDQEHYEALYHPIRAGEITVEDLDRVLGDPKAITEIVNRSESNPYPGIVFGFGGPHGLGKPRGRKIKEIWATHADPEKCVYIASIGTGPRNSDQIIGMCGDPEVQAFVRKFREGFVLYETDIEEQLSKPFEDVPAPEGGVLTATPVDIERELDMARNVFGRLRPDIKTRLRAVLYQPNEETWEDAHTIIVGADGWTTLWKAVIAVDPTFPKVGPSHDARGRITKRWSKIPSQKTLLQALRYATH